MSKLPKINQPTLVTGLPISKQKVKYRPFVVREQQSLLLAQQSEEPESIYSTIEDVLESCTAGTVDLESVPLCDLSYLFLQIHIASVGQEITVTTPCDNKECNNKIQIQLNLENVEISEATSNIVKIENDIAIKFRYPTYKDTLILSQSSEDPVVGIYHLVDSIFDELGIYTKDDYTLEEFKVWFGDMNDKQLSAIYEFVDGLPELVYDLKYTCPKCKNEHSKRLEGLDTFFRLSYEYRQSI